MPVLRRACERNRRDDVTDTFTGNEGDQQQQGDGGNESAHIRHLRERAEAATAAEVRAAAAERRLAVLEAGIDTDNPMGKFFVEHYDGDMTDIEALKAAATAHGIPLKGTPAGDGQQPQGDQQQQDGGQGLGSGAQSLEPTGTDQRRVLAGEGNSGAGVENPDPRQGALERAQDAIKQGARQEEAAGSFIADLAGAAMRGDRRVVVPDKHFSRTES